MALAFRTCPEGLAVVGPGIWPQPEPVNHLSPVQPMAPSLGKTGEP